MDIDINSTSFAVAFLAGLIPALFWLWFWLKEDKKNPEPLLLIALSFIGGMLVVPLVIPLQYLAMNTYSDVSLMFAWVVIEEVMKYGVALLVILWNRAVDEPIDVIIYMIAIALGFAALENTLYVLGALSNEGLLSGILTGNLRFVGATLLHVLASGTIGVFLALAFYSSTWIKNLMGLIGLSLAIILHFIFNFSLMLDNENSILGVFLFVWMGIIILLILFEKVKIVESKHQELIK